VSKLILAVLHQFDAGGVVTALEGTGHRLTQIPSELPLVVRGRLKDELPPLVKHGGATILIVDLERVLQV
jgi:uncharacterized protein YaaQ